MEFDFYPQKAFCEFGFYGCDVTEPTQLVEVLQKVKPQVMIHSARISLLARDGTVNDTPALMRINAGETSNVLSIAKESGVKAVVYLNTADVIVGGSSADYIDIDESQPSPRGFDDPCNESVLLAEKLVLSSLSSDFRTSVVRPATLIDSSSAGTVTQLYRGRGSLFLQSSSTAKEWSFTSVDNAASAIIFAAESLVRSALGANVKVFFIADWPPVPFNDFDTSVLCELGFQISPQVAGGQLSGSRTISGTRTFNYNLAKQILGYKPAMTSAQGIQKACLVSAFPSSRWISSLNVEVGR
jgi:sterol-4alpha-carboxylate 3-dehydrogenase (decarboxylating)